MRGGLAIGAVLLAGASAPPAERVVSGDGVIDASVNGTPARLRIDPAAPGMPVIARELAIRTGLKITGGWGIGIGYSVGGVAVMLRTQVVRLVMADAGGRIGEADKRRVGWTSRPFAQVADGSAGPDAMPEPVVRFRLRKSVAGERTISFPAVRSSGPFGLFAHYSATFAEIEVGGEPMRVRFDPYHARTLATAGAAVRLARLHDGVISGEAVPTEIFFGVERPVRTLTLRRPLPLGPLAIATLGVRTSDYGNAAVIREASAAVEPVDPDEIVVTGKGGKRDTRHDTLSLGADYLSRCSEILFDKPARAIRLSCLQEERP